MEHFKPTDEDIKKKQESLHPISADLNDYKESLGNGTQRFRGLESGFDKIDNLIGGLDRFIILAGRSGAGKTTLALQLALGVARKGVPVLCYSYEMSRNEVITKLVQLTAVAEGTAPLYTKTIELEGHETNIRLGDDYRNSLTNSLRVLNRTGERFYIKDSQCDMPQILPPSKAEMEMDSKKAKAPTMYDDIEFIKKTTKSDRVLVLIDSVQDVVNTQNPNQVQAEVEAVSKLTVLQQRTGATIFATAQKNKGSINSSDSYGDVLGSVSMLHKPNTVVELLTPRELINKTSKEDRERFEREIVEITEKAKQGGGEPMYFHIIKGRFTGEGEVALTKYGAFGYFGLEPDKNYNDFYKSYR